MNDVYKVTSTKITKSKRGYAIFNYQLNHSVWITKLAPIKNTDEQNDEFLNNLIGKYIVGCLINSDDGMKFSVASYDMIEDFKKLLDTSNKKSFSTDLPIYNFLKKLHYPINPDGSISLKKPYDFYNVINHNTRTLCYQKSDKKNVLSIDNLEIIYKQFYEGKRAETKNIDIECKYGMTYTAIIKHCERYHKYKGKIIRRYDDVILELGDELTQEQIEFLAKSK